jgi:small-conductance mechanosensitive channel
VSRHGRRPICRSGCRERRSDGARSRRSRDQVVGAIKQALDDAGIEIPYPYRTLTFTKNEPDIIRALRTAGRG